MRSRASIIAKRIALTWDVGFDVVNATLNRLVNVRSVKQADAPQLRSRLGAGQSWLETGEPPQRMSA